MIWDIPDFVRALTSFNSPGSPNAEYSQVPHQKALAAESSRQLVRYARKAPDSTLQHHATAHPNLTSDALRMAARLNSLTQHNRPPNNRHATRLTLVFRLSRLPLPKHIVPLPAPNPHHIHAPTRIPPRKFPRNSYTRGPCSQSINSIKPRDTQVQDLRCADWRRRPDGSIPDTQREGPRYHT